MECTIDKINACKTKGTICNPKTKRCADPGNYQLKKAILSSPLDYPGLTVQRCGCLTLKNTQCTRNSLIKSPYCNQHHNCSRKLSKRKSPMKLSPKKTTPNKLLPKKTTPIKLSPIKLLSKKATPIKFSPIKTPHKKLLSKKTTPIKLSPKLKKYNDCYITMLSVKYRHEVSLNGYSLDVLKSGLQKYIRRGNYSKAHYCAGELDLFKEAVNDGGKINRGEAIRTNFLHRLMVIYLEDVGNTSLLERIDKLLNSVFEERTKDDRDKKIEEKSISEVVYLLSGSEKSRICSHIRAVFYDKYRAILNMKQSSIYLPIKKMWDIIDENKENYKPSTSLLEFNCAMFDKYLKLNSVLSVYYAFQIDKSDEKLGKKINRSNNPVMYIFQKLGISDSIYYRWYKNHIGKLKEGFLCWLNPLLTHINIIKKTAPVTIDEGTKSTFSWERNRKNETIDIDDYIIDRHTKYGKNKNMVEFAVTGAYVDREASYVNVLWKQYYEDTKRYEENERVLGDEYISIKSENKPEMSINKDADKKSHCCDSEEKGGNGIPLETEELTYIVLTQLVTSVIKRDVYFATDKSGKLVVVKGPYKDRTDIDKLHRNTQFKIKNNIPFINYKIVQLIPNRYPKGLPLGIRNKLDITKPAWFILYDSMIRREDIKMKLHSSKKWPETTVVDWDKIPMHLNIKNLSEREMMDYVHALLYRYVRGVSDLADRNFINVNNTVISIDEDIEHHDVNMYAELRKNKAKFVYDWIKLNYDKLKVLNWQSIPEADNSEKMRLEVVKNKEAVLSLFESS